MKTKGDKKVANVRWKDKVKGYLNLKKGERKQHKAFYNNLHNTDPDRWEEEKSEILKRRIERNAPDDEEQAADLD